MQIDSAKDVAGADGAARPARCPACQSSDLMTTSKVLNADSYWRCCACGEVWNAARYRPQWKYDAPFRR